MAYVRKRTIVTLEYKGDHEWAGLTVKARSLSTGVVIDFSQLQGLQNKNSAEMTPEERKVVEMLFGVFADSLVWWDLLDEPDEEGGEPKPTPPTLEGIRSHDFDFMMQLMVDWMNRIMSISDSLKKDSSSGPQYPEGRGRMEPPPSLSLQSYVMPDRS